MQAKREGVGVLHVIPRDIHIRPQAAVDGSEGTGKPVKKPQ
jgi:hypothetical protein